MESSKRQLKRDLNILFGIASMELGGTIPRKQRTKDVKEQMMWLRVLKSDVYEGLGLKRAR